MAISIAKIGHTKKEWRGMRRGNGYSKWWKPGRIASTGIYTTAFGDEHDDARRKELWEVSEIKGRAPSKSVMHAAH